MPRTEGPSQRETQQPFNGLGSAGLSGHVIHWAEKGQCRPMVSTLSTGVLAVVLLGAAPGWATTVIQKSFAEVVQEAEVIAVGTVTAIAAEWDAAHSRPFTLVTFSTLDVLKGAHAEPELTLRVLGGPHPDGSILQIVGVPQFSIGERLVVFVTGNDHYAVPLVGLWQGVYRVVFDAERGVDTIYSHARQPVTSLPTATGGILHEDNHLSSAVQQPAPAMSLETFTAVIAQEVGHD